LSKISNIIDIFFGPKNPKMIPKTLFSGQQFSTIGQQFLKSDANMPTKRGVLQIFALNLLRIFNFSRI